MIDAIYKWISEEFPATTFVKQSWLKTSPQNSVLITDFGGTKQEYPNPVEVLKIQIISYFVTDARARQIALDIYDFIGERYETTLSDGESDFKFGKIKPIDRPISLGSDGQGFSYSINYEFIALGQS